MGLGETMVWKEQLARWLVPESFLLFDRRREEINSLKIEKEAFRQRINVLEDQVTDLKDNLTEVKKDALKSPLFSLESFKTKKTYKFNRTYKQMHQMLNIKAERDAVEDWVEENLDLSRLNGLTKKEKKKLLRLLVDEVAPAHKLYTKDAIPNTFTLPSDFILRGLKGNCNDWFLFIFYIYAVVFPNDDDVYAVMGGLNLPEGWNSANHAYCVWQHSDGKFYVIESSVGTGSPWNTYISASIDAFGTTDIVHNFRYGRAVWVANSKETYYQVVFQ